MNFCGQEKGVNFAICGVPQNEKFWSPTKFNLLFLSHGEFFFFTGPVILVYEKVVLQAHETAWNLKDERLRDFSTG